MKASAPQVIATARNFGVNDFQSFILLAGIMSIFHAGYEEFYWRKFIFGQGRLRMPIWVAHLVTALAFSANHVVSGWAYGGWRVGLVTGLVVAVAGLSWSLQYRRHGMILGVWISHGICDLALFYVEWLMISGRIGA